MTDKTQVEDKPAPPPKAPPAHDRPRPRADLGAWEKRARESNGSVGR